MMKKKKLDEIKEEFKLVHGNLYDYSKFNEYFGTHIKITIICKEHGEFEQTTKSHIKGAGCIKCGYIYMKNKQKSNVIEFIKKAKLKHGDNYDYSKVEYINATTKVIIICKEHGEFLQTPMDIYQMMVVKNVQLL